MASMSVLLGHEKIRKQITIPYGLTILTTEGESGMFKLGLKDLSGASSPISIKVKTLAGSAIVSNIDMESW